MSATSFRMAPASFGSHLLFYDFVCRTACAGNGNETLYFGATLAGKHADERAFAMSGHCDAGEAFVFGKKVYPARHIVYIILEAVLDSSLPAAALPAMPRLSKRSEAMPSVPVPRQGISANCFSSWDCCRPCR